MGWCLSYETKIKVKGKCPLHETSLMAAKFKDHAKMKSLPFNVVETAANDAVAGMEAVCKFVDGHGLPYERPVEQKDELLKAVEKYKVAVKDVLMYKRGLLSLRARCARGTLERRRGWRTKRDAYVKSLRSRGMPKGLAKVMGDHLQCLAEPPEKADVRLLFHERCLAEDSTIDEDFLRLPFIIRDVGHYGRAITRTLADNEDEIKDVVKLVVESNKQAGNPAGQLTANMKEKFPWDAVGDGATNFFKEVVDVKPVIIVQDHGFFQAKPKGFPFRGGRCILSAISGDFLFVVVGAEDNAAHADLAAWMKSAEAKDLEDVEAFYAMEGQSIWIPFGSAPIFIGMAPNTDWKEKAPTAKGTKKAKSAPKKKKSVTLGSWFCLDSAVDKAQSPVVANFVASTWISNHSFLPKSFQEAAKLNEWTTALAAVAPAAA